MILSVPADQVFHHVVVEHTARPVQDVAGTISARDLPVGTLGARLDSLYIASLWYNVPYKSMGQFGNTRLWCLPTASDDGTNAYEYAKYRNAWCIVYCASPGTAAAASQHDVTDDRVYDGTTNGCPAYDATSGSRGITDDATNHEYVIYDAAASNRHDPNDGPANGNASDDGPANRNDPNDEPANRHITHDEPVNWYSHGCTNDRSFLRSPNAFNVYAVLACCATLLWGTRTLEHELPSSQFAA